MIDLHCHLDLYPQPAHVIDECKRRGVFVLSVTTTPSAWHGTSALAHATNSIRTALGLHPQLAHERKGEVHLFDELLPQARYVGEIGLDGAPEFRQHWRDQMAVFEHILGSCQQAGGRIMSIHSRRSTQTVLDCLEKHADAGIPVLHWFSGNFSDLNRAIDRGYWFSVGPAMLHGTKGRALAERMPRDRILTESDGPFVQLHGHSILPWEVSQAVDALGRLWSIASEETQKALRDNLRRLLELI